jgi:hypothetical protein
MSKARLRRANLSNTDVSHAESLSGALPRVRQPHQRTHVPLNARPLVPMSARYEGP